METPASLINRNAERSALPFEVLSGQCSDALYGTLSNHVPQSRIQSVMEASPSYGASYPAIPMVTPLDAGVELGDSHAGGRQEYRLPARKLKVAPYANGRKCHGSRYTLLGETRRAIT